MNNKHQPRSKHESSSSSSSSLDEFKTPRTSAGDVIPPPVRRTCRGSTTRRHQYKKDDDHSTSASLGQQGLRAPANAPVTGGVVRRMRWSQSINESVMRAYYGATEGGTNLTSYRSRMLSMFQALQPTMTVIKGRIQKAVVLETARIVRRFLTLEP
ncbi:jg1851 [Pararge aegeria aegeria]|uniref:Jg1851 protein n=1 Tax=Pararge aegeria aegeria TaxID=348720 RepID=A0A8S4RII3_9NEOP|nr:jg1851 [Pararge aegeria aegeria]